MKCDGNFLSFSFKVNYLMHIPSAINVLFLIFSFQNFLLSTNFVESTGSWLVLDNRERVNIPDPANGQYVEFGEGDCCCMLVCLSPPTGGGLGCDEDELDFLLFPACKLFSVLN